MKKLLGVFLAFGLLSAGTALADSGSGCGLGKQVWIGQSGLVPHLLALTTNNLISPASSSMTSGTSGCKADGVIFKSQEAEVFVAVNLDNLSQEMAQGKGTYLDSLASLMGCSAVSSEFASMTQSKYAELISASDLIDGLKREISADQKLAAGCTVS